MKAVNIKWVTDSDEWDSSEELELPTEIEIPEGMNDIDEISDYLSDTTGFLHEEFELI